MVPVTVPAMVPAIVPISSTVPATLAPRGIPGSDVTPATASESFKVSPSIALVSAPSPTPDDATVVAPNTSVFSQVAASAGASTFACSVTLSFARDCAAAALTSAAATPRSASGSSAARCAIGSAIIGARKGWPTSFAALSRSAGSLRRQQSSNDTKAAGQREGSLSVGGGSLVMRKSARSIGFTCQSGGTCSASSSAVMPRDQMSAPVE
mmetsp:Transcript_71852/g.215979  ORF Transcript_71852/g.215979 Transcript_71852/m.215979 type:complete len:210 (-) Transcript_71852:398-1027(-)